MGTRTSTGDADRERPSPIVGKGEPMTTGRTTDEELLASFRAGNRDAFGLLASRHETALLGLAKGLLGGSRTLATEAVQDTWVRVIRHAHTFDSRASVRTWLYRIVINRCRDVNARERRAATLARAFAVNRRPVGQAKRPRIACMNAESTASTMSDDLAALLPALATLPEDRREVVVLVYGRGMTHEAAADVLAIPLGTLKSRLHAALRHLREQMNLGDAVERERSEARREHGQGLGHGHGHGESER